MDDAFQDSGGRCVGRLGPGTRWEVPAHEATCSLPLPLPLPPPSLPPTHPLLSRAGPPCPAPPRPLAPQDEQRTLQTLNDRLAMLRLKKGDLEKRIRELGSLPDEAFEKYRGHGLKRLQQELAQVGGCGCVGRGAGRAGSCRAGCAPASQARCQPQCRPLRATGSALNCLGARPRSHPSSPLLPAPCPQVNGELKKFGHINRKALDQYMNFSEQRDQLYRRKQVRGTAPRPLPTCTLFFPGLASSVLPALCLEPCTCSLSIRPACLPRPPAAPLPISLSSSPVLCPAPPALPPPLPCTPAGERQRRRQDPAADRHAGRAQGRGH